MSLWCDRIITGGILFLVLSTPFAFGSVHPWAYSTMEAVIFSLVIVWMAKVAILARGQGAGSRGQMAGESGHIAIRLPPHHLAPPVPRSLADPYRSSEIRRLCGAVFSDLALPLWRILGTSRYALVVHQPAPPGTEVLSLACVRDSFYRLVCCRDRLC